MSRSSIVALQPIYMRLNGPFGTPPVVVGVFVAVCVTKVPFLALISAVSPDRRFYDALFTHHSAQKRIAALCAFICDLLHMENICICI